MKASRIGIIIALDAGRTVAPEDFAHSFGQLPSLEQPMPKQLISRVGIREGRTWLDREGFPPSEVKKWSALSFLLVLQKLSLGNHGSTPKKTDRSSSHRHLFHHFKNCTQILLNVFQTIDSIELASLLEFIGHSPVDLLVFVPGNLWLLPIIGDA